MKKILNIFMKNPVGEKKILELAIENVAYTVISLIILIGLIVGTITSKNELLKSFAIVTALVTVIMFILAGLYYYYYKTGKYVAVVGTCVGIEQNFFKKTVKKECTVYIKDEDGVNYKFKYQYKSNLFKEGNKIKVYVPYLNTSYRKDNSYYLDGVFLLELINEP